MTSAIITNTIVSNSSLPESPIRGFRLPGSASIMPSDLSADSKFTSAEDSHPANDAPRPDTGQTWHEIVNRRAFSNLRQRRIGQNQTSYVAKPQIPHDRKNPHGNQLTCLCTDNRDTHYLTFCRRDDFYMTVWGALCQRTVIVVIRPTSYANLDALLTCLRLCKPDLRKLRIGKDNPRDASIVNAHRQAE